MCFCIFLYICIFCIFLYILYILYCLYFRLFYLFRSLPRRERCCPFLRQRRDSRNSYTKLLDERRLDERRLDKTYSPREQQRAPIARWRRCSQQMFVNMLVNMFADTFVKECAKSASRF